jgi:hypothetical protein
MHQLRDTQTIVDGTERGLLGEVDVISSVSSGGVTAACYGFFGEGMPDPS